MRPAAAPFDGIRLSPGQSLHTAAEAGTVLRVTEGRVRIDEAPQWLAERCMPVGRTLKAGQHHVVAQSGWIAVTALGVGQGACLHQAPARPTPVTRSPWPVWRFMRRLMGT